MTQPIPSSEDPGVPIAEQTAPIRDTAVERDVVDSVAHFRGRVLALRTDEVDLGDGQRVHRDFVEHPGAVGVIAVDERLRVLLVHQYRHPVRALLWEPPAGLLDVPGEDPADAAARELYEEGGYRASRWEVLVDAFTSPGGSDEAVRVYLARELTEVDVDERHAGVDEERDMPSRWVPLREAREAVFAGALHNPLGIMGILAASTLLLDAEGPDGGAVPRPADAPWFRGGPAGGG